MADTPPVAGPLPIWYTAAQQSNQFGCAIPGFGQDSDSAIRALSSPPVGAIVAEDAITSFSQAAEAGDWTYPASNNSWAESD